MLGITLVAPDLTLPQKDKVNVVRWTHHGSFRTVAK
jgi:hypothetical protein